MFFFFLHKFFVSFKLVTFSIVLCFISQDSFFFQVTPRCQPAEHKGRLLPCAMIAQFKGRLASGTARYRLLQDAMRTQFLALPVSVGFILKQARPLLSKTALVAPDHPDVASGRFWRNSRLFPVSARSPCD